MVDADKGRDKRKNKLYKYFILKVYHRDEYSNKKKGLNRPFFKFI